MERPNLDSQAHLRLLGRILRRRWKLMLALFLGLAIPISANNLLLEKKTFEAVATLFVDASPEEYSLIKEWIPGSDIPLQMAVLRSRSLAELVADSLPRESIDELLKEGLYRDYVLELRNRFRKILGRELVVYSPKERAVMELQNARTSFAVKGSQVEIRTIATRPKVAMDLANTYVEILLARSRSFVREEARAAREFLEQQLAQAQETLKEHEERLAKSRTAGGGLQLTQRAELDLTRLVQAEANLAEVQLNKEFANSRLASLRAYTEKGGADAGSAEHQRLKERRAHLEDRLAALLERYTEQHPIVTVTKSEIQEIQRKQGALPPEVRGPGRLLLPLGDVQKQIADVERETAALQIKEEMLQQRAASIRRSLTGRSGEELEYSRILRRVDSQRNFTSLLMDKLTTARIREQGEVKSLRVIDLASLPMAPSGARTTKKIAMGILLSLALSLGLGGLLEFFKDPVETEDDVRQATGLPLLGYLPRLGAKEIQNGTAGSPFNLWEDPTRPILFAERCRGMASLLEAMGRERPLRTLMVTSAAPAEGKSTVLVNLAWAYSELGKRLVLVDSDLRRPALSRAFRLSEGPGLTDVLSGNAKGDAPLVQLREGVQVLRSGASHPAPQSLLTREPTARLLAQLQARADLVLFDSAPLSAIADNFHLAGLVDGVILVTRAGESQKRELTRVKAELERFGATILGVVLNALSPSAVKRSYGKYYAYYTGGASSARGWRRWLPWLQATVKGRRARRAVSDKGRTHEEEGSP
ncbi:MAG: polysaccharide biosynthesis tyrosine autokinase [candidate division NC10 bacterium]|nr:polysaccharide biosynthesis tyrosine autokinase [candidate division NC10 bacterium]